MRLRFDNFEAVVKWMSTTRFGNDCVREVLYSKAGARLYGEFVEREMCLAELPARPTYVLVKACGDGWIEVYGEKHVRAKIVVLPIAESVDAEKLLEQWVDMNLKMPYREINYPSNKRTAAHVAPYLSLSEFLHREIQRDLDVEDLRIVAEWGRSLLENKRAVA